MVAGDDKELVVGLANDQGIREAADEHPAAPAFDHGVD